jgi:tyrosine-protein kinase
MVELIIQIVKRWLWLIILIPIIAAGTAYGLLRDQPEIYRGKALLLIGPSTTSPNPELRDLQAAGQLLETYAAIAVTQPFMAKLIEDLELELDANQLEDMIQITTTPETQILSIRVFDTDPDRAIVITNALVESVIGISPNSRDINSQYRDQLTEQIQRLEQRIQDSVQIIDEMETSVELATSSEERIAILNNILQERNRLSNSEELLVTLFAELQSPSTNYIELIEPAEVAKEIRSNLLLKVVVSAGAAFLLVAGAIVTFEYLDDTLHSVSDLSMLHENHSLLGHLTQEPLDNSDNSLVTERKDANTLGSNAFIEAESYRKLTTRLIHKMNLITPSKRSHKVIMLTSPDDADVTAFVVANLGVVMSRMGADVTLIDANLYTPKLHTLFGIANDLGLTSALSGQAEAINVEGSGLKVLPAGEHDGHAFEIISSEEMHNFLEEYQQDSRIVLIAAPPLNIAASAMLSQHVDSCILITVAKKNRLRQVDDAVNRIHNLAGTIFVDGARHTIEV